MGIEGARWNEDTQSIDDSRPKQLYTLMPVIHLDPEKDRKATTEGVYRMPVYKELSRRGILSTTPRRTARRRPKACTECPCTRSSRAEASSRRPREGPQGDDRRRVPNARVQGALAPRHPLDDRPLDQLCHVARDPQQPRGHPELLRGVRPGRLD